MQNVKLADIAEIYAGLSYRRYLDDEGIECNVVVQRSIQSDGRLDDFENLRLSPKIKGRFFSKKGDVLMKMPYPFDVVEVNQEGLVISDRIAIIRLNEDHDPAFIAHMLTNAHVKKQLHEIGTTERMPHISIKDIKEIRLNLPDLGKQKKHGELLNTINEKITKDMQVVEYDRRLKEGILNKLWEEG